MGKFNQSRNLIIEADNFDDLYIKTLETLLIFGTATAPRGLKTLEVHPQLLCLQRPERRLLLNPIRRISPGFMCAEALWILSGSNAEWIFDFNPNLRQYADDGILKGAYGPRLRRWQGEVDQFQMILDLFSRDIESRQGTMVIFDPSLDFQSKKDVPCTNLIRFLIRNQQLDMITIMRSQDGWLGLPYDIFTFTLIQEVIAGFLNVQLGTYYHFVDSLHLYEYDIEKAKKAVKFSISSLPECSILSASLPWNFFDPLLRLIVQHVIEEPNLEKILKIDLVWWRNLALIMLAYRNFKEGDFSNAYSIVGFVSDEALKHTFMVWQNSMNNNF